jgi:hypothetical protein
VYAYQFGKNTRHYYYSMSLLAWTRLFCLFHNAHLAYEPIERAMTSSEFPLKNRIYRYIRLIFLRLAQHVGDHKDLYKTLGDNVNTMLEWELAVQPDVVYEAPELIWDANPDELMVMKEFWCHLHQATRQGLR